MKRGIDRRPGARQRGYTAEYERLRQEMLDASPNPRCVECGGPGEVVDHVVPLKYGGRNERGNLQWLCRKHNTKKAFRDKWKFEGKSR